MTGAIGPGAFILGCLLLAVELACSATAAVLIVRRRAGALRGVPRLVALALLGVLGIVAIQVVPLTLGILTRGTVLVAALALLGAATLVPAGRAACPDDAPPPRFGATGVSWALAGAGAVLFAAFALAYLELSSTVHPISVDALGFHFPGVIRFIQSGTLWQSTQYLPGQAQGNYPQNGDMLMLAFVLPWHSLALVRLLDPLLLALATVSVYAIGRELGAPAPTAILAALAACAIRPALGPALTDVLTDPAFLAGFAAGTLFLLRHWRTGARSELLLAGAGFGLALGTKWYGLTDVPAVVLVWLVAGRLGGRPWRELATDTGVLVVVVLLTGGIWLLRNLILTGNPVFDYRLSLFGVTIFAAPPDPLRSQLGFTLAHYLPHPTILKDYVWPVFRSDFGVTGALCVLGAVGAGVLVVAGRLQGRPVRDAARVTILALGALLCAVAYLITPYSAQGFAGHPVLVASNTRYGAPALLLAAPVLAWLAGRLGRWRLVLEAALLAAMIVDVRRYLVSSAGRIVLSAAVVLALAALWWALSARRGSLRLAFVAALACLVAVASYHYQRVLARSPYAPADPTIAYVLAHDPAHTRIGITGEWTAQGVVPVAPLFGPRLENDVSYVGPWIRHRLEQYTAQEPFVAALRAGRYALLEIGTGFPPRPDPIQARWALAAGYRVITASDRLVLMGRAGA
ncbi:MAG TPA: phospholipid carrier-dependent glycosyltransferase [Solirubrobacteraceae bacterium]|nr:phospholipid carrier-dependent glycosyltransferase [Solirubrobacteraceae bacterium]